ncbi:hypothetical protein EDM52_10430 [Brevibacillus invocatus]|uniref:Uncharacterized protein n=1 Tax=Brevibacillus invocatus TaxID=173959 RepID=A0A3M8CFX6_9BACL|nr:hypothetical protein EDM52_10430 [Brevibacillus invocatus]
MHAGKLLAEPEIFRSYKKALQKRITADMMGVTVKKLSHFASIKFVHFFTGRTFKVTGQLFRSYVCNHDGHLTTN